MSGDERDAGNGFGDANMPPFFPRNGGKAGKILQFDAVTGHPAAGSSMVAIRREKLPQDGIVRRVCKKAKDATIRGGWGHQNCHLPDGGRAE